MPQSFSNDSFLSKGTSVTDEFVSPEKRLYYESYAKIVSEQGKNATMLIDAAPEYTHNFVTVREETKTVYHAPYVENPYNLGNPVIREWGLDVSHGGKERPSQSDYAWRNRNTAEREYDGITWHNGMDIFADLYQEVFAVDDSITFRYQIPYSGGKTPIQAVATVFLDQKKFGMNEFTNTGEVSYNVNGMNKLIPDKSTYDNVKDLGGDALQRWAENAVSTDSSYFLNTLETPIDERTIAYASYLHVVYDKVLLPEDGTVFMKGASLGGIADGTGGGVSPVNYDLRNPDNNGFGVHLHFELYIPKDLNAFRPDGRLFNVQKYSAGSVNPRKYISFEDQEYWQY